jgi:hypothetical protein
MLLYFSEKFSYEHLGKPVSAKRRLVFAVEPLVQDQSQTPRKNEGLITPQKSAMTGII